MEITMNKKGNMAVLAMAIALSFGVAASAQAKTLVLEGSDATSFHGAQPGGPTYTTQLFSFLKGTSPYPVAVFGGTLPSAPAGTVYLSNLSGLSTSSYSALYIESPYGCCDQNLTGAAAWALQINTFYTGGGSVAIQDYTGGDWSFIDPILATPPVSATMGYQTAGGGNSCTDGEVFTDALTKGFTQPPALGCWEHQAYSKSYYVGTLGFNSLVDADPGYGIDASGKPAYSAMLALGGELGTVGAPVPVPAAAWLLGSGLLGLIGVARRKAA